MTSTAARAATFAALVSLATTAVAQSAGPENRIRGLVKPQMRAVISSQIQGRIDELPFEDGDRFAKGDVLVRFDCSLYQANLNSAAAEYQARQRRHTNNAELAQLDAIASIDVRVSEAEMRKAAADVKAARVTVSRCEILAPFNGRVATREANLHENVAADQPLMTILDDSELEIELIVPSRWLRWVKPSVAFEFDVDETGQTHAAVVDRLGASVDPVSQTIRLTGVLPPGVAGVLAGMSGTARFEQPPPEVAQAASGNKAAQ